jgi:hypothetical protein
MTRSGLARSDRAALLLVLFYIACALTLELYWLVHHAHLPERHDILAQAFAFFGRGDRGYYDRVTSLETGLESFQILITQPVLIVLAAGILRNSLWRYPLQIGVGSYVCYSTALYLVAKHVSGYADMPSHDWASLLILYLPNLPWLLGNAWLAWDAARSVTHAFRQAETAV